MALANDVRASTYLRVVSVDILRRHPSIRPSVVEATTVGSGGAQAHRA